MKLKVIKEIKGLVPGDILDYNENNDSFEISKVEENITESGVSKKTLKVTIASYLVEDFKDYFITIDDEGNPITEERIRYSDNPENKDEIDIKEDNRVEELTKKVEELQKELEEVKPYKWIDYNEWKALRDYYNNHPLNHPFRVYWA